MHFFFFFVVRVVFLQIVKAAEGLELNKKGRLVEATKRMPAKKTQ